MEVFQLSPQPLPFTAFVFVTLLHALPLCPLHVPLHVICLGLTSAAPCIAPCHTALLFDLCCMLRPVSLHVHPSWLPSGLLPSPHSSWR
jgi:hypothetical protein